MGPYNIAYCCCHRALNDVKPLHSATNVFIPDNEVSYPVYCFPHRIICMLPYTCAPNKSKIIDRPLLIVYNGPPLSQARLKKRHRLSGSFPLERRCCIIQIQVPAMRVTHRFELLLL